MIVHEPQIVDDGVDVTASVEIEVERPNAEERQTVWFKVPHRYKGAVTTRSDAFAAAILPLAMVHGEPLEIRGELSYRLAYGLREYLRVQSTWKPDTFKPVELRFASLVHVSPVSTTGAVGTSFSGGVDSFHTLLTHLPGRDGFEKHTVTHCVMINGFDRDTDLDGTGSFGAMQRLYGRLLLQHGVELIVVRSNLLDLVGWLIQKQSFASFVTAPALLLGGLFERFFVASSYQFTLLGLYPDGSHLMLDHYLATEAMETIHDGGHLTRVEKTAALATWADTYHSLRVCFEKTSMSEDGGTVLNCCRCEKCLRTMATLEVEGALRHYRCFPEPLTHRALRRTPYVYLGSRIFADEVIARAKTVGRLDIARDFRISLLRSTLVLEPIRWLARASRRIEELVPLYGTLIAPFKTFAKHRGWGEPWIY